MSDFYNFDNAAVPYLTPQQQPLPGGTYTSAPAPPAGFFNSLFGGGVAPSTPVPSVSATTRYPFAPPEAQAFPEPSAGNVLPGGGVFPPSPLTASARGATPTGSSTSSLRDALRGATAPAAPTPQQVRTPPPPTVRPIGASDLVNMMASLGITPQQFQQFNQARFGRA